jgi:hypothetical protein
VQVDIQNADSNSEKLEVHSMQTAARFDSIDRQTQQILTAILESKREVIHDSSGEFKDDIATLTTAIAQLLSRVESLNHDNHQHSRHDISANNRRIHTESQTDWSRLKLAQGFDVSKSEEITANIELLDVTKSQEQLIRSSVQRTIIQSLGYGTMTTRYVSTENLWVYLSIEICSISGDVNLSKHGVFCHQINSPLI